MSHAARLSKLLFEARELIDMLGVVVEGRTGIPDGWSARVRDEIDAYRAQQGWSPDGFGGEAVDPATEGPEQGHRFRFSVISAMSSSVEGVPGHTDADWWSEPWTLEVRAWSLPAALRKAGDLSIAAWDRT